MNPPDPINPLRSLRSKLLLPLVLTGVAVAALALWGIQRQERQQMEAQLQLRAELIAHMVNYAAESVSRPVELQRIVAAIGADPDVIDIVVAGGEPVRVLASTRTGWFGKLLTDLPGAEFADDLRQAIRTRVSHHHFNAAEHLLDFSAPLLLSQHDLAGGERSAGAVTVHMDTRPMLTALGKSVRELSAIFLAGLLLLGMLGYGLVSRRVLRPLAAIGTAVRAGSSASLKSWEKATTNDELGTLAHVLRESMARNDDACRALEMDITRRKQAEDEIRESQRFLQSTLDALSAHIAILDETGVIIAVNAVWRRFAAANDLAGGSFGLGSFGLGSNYLSVCESSTGDCSVEAVAVAAGIRGLLEGSSREFQLEYPCHSPAEQRWFNVRLTSFAENGPIRIVVAHENITSRKFVEEQLGQSVQLQEMALAGAELGVWDWNVVSGKTVFDQRWCAMLGYQAHELEHTVENWVSLLNPEDAAPTKVILDGHLRGETPIYHTEFRMRHREGHWVWIQGRGKVVEWDAAGAPLRMTGTHMDITARKCSEVALAKAHRELLETSRMAGKAEVATSVLHNVGNVLNSVNVSAHLVSDQVRKTPVADLGRVVALLREQGANLGAFFTSDPRGPKVADFLAQLAEKFTRQQESQLTEVAALQKNIEHIKDIVAMQQSYAKVSGLTENLSPVELIEDALRMNAGSFQKHEVELVRELPADLPRVCVDKHKVLQILVNLLRNAKHACEDAGRPDKRITVRTAHEHDRVRITITDNGVGIPPENLNRIFNHGFTTKKEGHGFGLHSAANAAKEMGGSLTVHSEGAGQGASFHLELPAGKARQEQEKAA